ncbi:unnamed protein product [Ceutorhynchus assimilis]|uniref:TBC1 domain family member 30 n=1 Tax=Ceutorhynchus assimilis TaxID=467358 RepID=A0A9N9MWX5_9CUCU|nr:unnamed protein product [Ceutorhynchus assimilis]
MSGFLSSFNKTNKANNGIEKISASAADMRFTIQPTTPGESDFAQWVGAMKMVAQLPGGIPPEFRRRLWVTMAERHLESRGVDWSQVEKTCFGDWSHHADDELGIQIVKDLHRTGCSLFCGDEGQQNQALLKKVLMAYARWNKAVGYCQGFNMLAALILQVTDRSSSDALKLMIYLIEGVLPDSYFADSLRGLSVDMAVFRELLRSKLPRLSKHLDLLQSAAKDGARSYEPPLTNVFTMQWFLTLFCNCLPQPTVLRVWDLIFLEGNAVLLRTALAIWQVLAQQILSVRTADEFYCVMGALTRELLESNLINANTLIKAIVAVGPITELKSLREHYLYNITPWGAPAPINTRPTISLHPKMDIGALKQQYVKLKQRQRQAHVIFTSAVSGRPAPAATPVMNHLLVGKRALGPSKRPGPPKGSIPPARQHHPSTLHWKDATQPPTAAACCSSSSSSDTELCDEDDVPSSEEDVEEKKTEASQLDNSKPNTIADNLIQITPDLKIPSDCEEGDQSAEFELFLADRSKSKDSLIASSSPNKIPSDSEEGDESAEFERFLADRLKGDQTTRRNSELALQIIQENSLILHRIMQCQSRLSPSPPLLRSKDDDNSVLSEKQSNEDDFEGEATNNFDLSSFLVENDFDSKISITDYSDSKTQLIDFDPLIKEDSDQKLPNENKTDLDWNDEQSIKIFTEPKITIDDSHVKSWIENDFVSIETQEIKEMKLSFESKIEIIKNDSESPLLDDNSELVDFDQKLTDLDLISPLLPIKDNSDPETQLNSDLKIQSIKNEFDSLADSHPIKYNFDLLIKNDDIKLDDSLPDNNQYSSRLRSLLEKSKSLDEKYNFMLNKDKLTPTLGGLHESKSEEPLTLDKDNKSNQLIQENLYLLKTYSANKIKEERTSLSRKLFQENVCLLESISNKSDSIDIQNFSDDVSSSLTDLQAISFQIITDDDCDKVVIDSSSLSSPRNSPVKSDSDDKPESISVTTSANDLSNDNSRSPTNKSPDRVMFNPFPISMNSRQNKEVAVKLGLYKK